MTATTPHPNADVEQRLHTALRAYHELAAALLTGSDFTGLTNDTRTAICDLVTAAYTTFNPNDLTAANLPTNPPGTRVDELRRILQHPNPVPADIYDEVLSNPLVDVRRSLLHIAAQRADITADLVDRFLPYTNATILNTLAANPAIPPTTARLLASVGIGRASTLIALAGNPSLPADLVETFAEHPAYVRTELATRTDLPEEIARTLATDPSENVRTAITYNPHLPDDIRVLAALAATP